MQVIDIDKIFDKRTLKSGRSKLIYSNFVSKTRAAYKLWRFAEKYNGKGRRLIVAEARKQMVIALVTAFEVYMGDFVSNLID